MFKTYSTKILSAILLIGCLFFAKQSAASHFRYGNISWTRSNSTPTQVTFKVSQAWRSTFYFATASSPTVGSVISGGTLNFGDGTSATINITITSVNVADDWFYGEYTVTHTFPTSTSDYTANFSSSARIGTLQNNANGNFTVSSLVKGSVSASPSATMSPIINVSIGQTYATFQIPAADPNGLALTYSLTPAGSFGSGTVQPASAANFFIDPTTGVLSFNTAGKTIGQLFNTSISITNSLGATTMVDFVIKMVDNQPPPEFTYGLGNTPNNGTIYNVTPGSGALCFPVIASNPLTSSGAATTVVVSGVGLPVSSSFSTQSGTNPGSRTFCWTPTNANLGTNVITFVATNNFGVQTTTSVTIINSVNPVFVSPTPGNNSTYCAVPGVAVTPFTISAENQDIANLVSLSLQSTALSGMTFNPVLPTPFSNPVSSILNYTPIASDWGIKHVVIRATDQLNNHTDINYYFVVDNPPVITSTPVLTATVGVPYTYNLTATDADDIYGDELDLEQAMLPSFLTATDLGGGNVQISGIPTTPGTYNIDIEIEDSLNHFNSTHCGLATQSYTLVVSAACSATTSTTNTSICPSALPYSWNGLTFNAAGSQTAHLTNACGSDSAATLNLTVKTNTTSTTNTSICPSALPYSWNGSRAAAGTYTFVTTNSQGCDSTATLNLTVKTNTTSTTNTSICPSALPYSWNGSRAAAGTYTFVTTNSQGCDSTATLNLTVKTNTTSTTNVTICEYNAPYSWNGNSYNASGAYTLHFTNSQGCDSATILNLTITAKPNAGADHSITCGNGILVDTIKAITPLTGTWAAMPGNPSGATVGATTNGAAVANIPPPPFTGTFGYIYTANGCNDTMQFIVVGIAGNPMPAINGGTNPICKNGTVQLCPTVWGWANYQWYKNGVAIPPAVGVSSCITLDSTNVGSYTLIATNGAGCWTVPSTPIVVTYNPACNINPTNCLSGLTSPCLNTSYVCLGTNTTYDLTTITLTCTKPIGTILEWHSGNPVTVANKLSNATAAPFGTYWAAYHDTVNNCYGNYGFATQNVTVDTCSNIVSGGGAGGLETKTLGDIIANKLFDNAKNNIAEISGYNNSTKFIQSGAITNGSPSNLTLTNLMPATVIGTDVSYITTPTDLVTITNAKEVLAIDYTKAGKNKAVAFGTKTQGEIYSHTKAVCDRLKGATLLEVKTIAVNGYNLMAHKVQQCTGEIEYVINLSAGIAINRNTISLQSNWFGSSYVGDETMYNFQLWAASYNMVKEMAASIITKLSAEGTIQAMPNTDMPTAFISKGKRNATKVELTLQNNNTATSGYFEIKEKLNEKSSETVRRVDIVNLPINQSTISLNVADSYEGSIYLYLNGVKTDVLYLNDGTWNYDYNKQSNTTTIQQFKVLNDLNTTSVANTDYKLMRNVSISGTTKDYISVYKTLISTCANSGADVSNYKALLFNTNATGAGSVTITLIKKGITKWNEQYNYTMNLDGDKEYGINLNQFTSTKSTAVINANDITAVSFAYNNSRSVQITMNISLSKVRFTNTVSTITDNSLSTISVYPNPTIGKFVATYSSNANQNLVLKVVEASTGRMIKTQFIAATKGNNKTTVELNNTPTSSIYIVTLEGDGIKYNATKLMVNKK